MPSVSLTGSSGELCCDERLWHFWSAGFPDLGKSCPEILSVLFRLLESVSVTFIMENQVHSEPEQNETDPASNMRKMALNEIM